VAANNNLESMLTVSVVGNVTYSPVFCLQVLRNIKITPVHSMVLHCSVTVVQEIKQNKENAVLH
jgi:hypothetical protein